MSIVKDLLLLYNVKLLWIFISVLRGIYFCIVQNINYHEWLDE